MIDDEVASLGSQRVVEGDDHHGLAVEALLGQDPLGAVLRVDTDEGLGSRGQAAGDETCAEVLGPKESLVVV